MGVDDLSHYFSYTKLASSAYISSERSYLFCSILWTACKGKKLKLARHALQMPALNPQALELAQAFMAWVSRMDVSLCPVCKVGHLRTVEVLAGVRQLPVPGSLAWPQERGPP